MLEASNMKATSDRSGRQDVGCWVGRYRLRIERFQSEGQSEVQDLEPETYEGRFELSARV